MSEDIGLDTPISTDNSGIWRDPGGIVAMDETGSEHYDLDHGITLICDSHRHLIRRITVRFGDRKRKCKRIPCPECGRLVTVYVRQARP